MIDLSQEKLELLKQKREIKYFNEHEEMDDAVAHSVLSKFGIMIFIFF